MIRIVKEIYYTDLDNSGGRWYVSPMIPASARYKETSSSDEHGRLRKVELSYVAPYITPGLKGNLAILVVFDDSSRVSFGSTDVPVRFKIVEDDLFTLSCEHESPDR